MLILYLSQPHGSLEFVCPDQGACDPHVSDKRGRILGVSDAVHSQQSHRREDSDGSYRPSVLQYRFALGFGNWSALAHNLFLAPFAPISLISTGTRKSWHSRWDAEALHGIDYLRIEIGTTIKDGVAWGDRKGMSRAVVEPPTRWF